MTGQTTVFGQVLAEQMASRGLTPDDEGLEELARAAGYDPEVLQMRVQRQLPHEPFGPLSGIANVLALTELEKSRLALAYVCDEDLSAE